MLLLCSAMLLVAGLTYNLAHLETGGEALPAPPGPSPPPPNFWGLFDPNVLTEIFASLFLIFLIAGVIYVYLHRKSSGERPVVRPAGWRDFIPTLVAVLTFALLIYFWPRIAREAAGQNPSNTPAGNATANATTVPTVAGIPLGVFLVLALLLSVLVVALLMQASGRLKRMTSPSVLLSRRLAAAQAVDATISDLRIGADVRGAIMACFQRFCLLLGSRGIGGQDPLTPRELEGLAVRQLAVSAESAGSLTSLFEEARYSTHELGEPDRDRALESLARIRAALEA